MSISSGTSQPFSAEGYDRFGNDLGDETPWTTFRIGPDGQCSGTVCTAVLPGPHTVVASTPGVAGNVTTFAKATVASRGGLTAGPDGAIWYANGKSIGRLSPTGIVTIFSDPRMASVAGITAGPDGALWFTDNANNSIGRITIGGAVTMYSGPGISEPGPITLGPDGALWFTNKANNSIGSITTGGAVRNFVDPSINVPIGISSGPDGALWFTNGGANTIGRISPSGVVTSYGAPGINGPNGIATGIDGALWFTNYAPGSTTIGRITTGGVVSLFSDPSVNTPLWITAAPDGSLWFTNLFGSASNGGSVDRITTDGLVTSYEPLANMGSPASIAVGPDNQLWYNQFAPGAPINRITNAPSGSASLSVLPAAQAISFTSNPPTNAAVGGSYVPTAVGGASGNPVVLTIDGASSGCSLAGGTVTFTAPGTCVVDANQAGSAVYDPAPEQQQSISIAREMPALAWSTPSDIVYGTALGATQLDATASVPGSFTYSPAPGTVLGAGQSQILRAVFTPADTTDYTTASASVLINVAKATPVVSWSNPAAITYGTALGAVQLDASATVPGTFSYNPPMGTPLHAGKGQLNVDFIPTDSADYTDSSASALITVDPAPLNVAADRRVKRYGQDNPPLTYTVAGLVNGDTATVVKGTPVLATTATARSSVGSYPVTVDTSPMSVVPDYYLVAMDGALWVTPAPLTVTASDALVPYGSPPPQIDAAYAGFTNGDTVASLNRGATCGSTYTGTTPPGTYAGAASCGGAVDPNYAVTYVNGTVTITKAPTAVAESPVRVSQTLLGLNVTFSARLVSDVTQGPIVDQPVSFSVNGTPECTATTNSDAEATCTAPISNSVAVFLAGTTTASYAGNVDYLPSNVTTPNSLT